MTPATEILARAKAFQASRQTRPTAATVVEQRGDSVARRMADDMLDIAPARGDCVTDVDLMLRGWTPEAIARHQPEANRIAIAAARGEA